MQVLKTFRINLDLKRVTAQAEKIPPLVVGDNGNILEITLTDSGEPVNLGGCRVVAVFSTSDGQPVEQDTEGNGVTITGEHMNILVIDLKTTSYSVGKNNCEIQIYSGENLGTLVTTANFNFDGRPGILNDETIQAEDKFPILTALIERVENLATATGDMTKEEYDPDKDGVVEKAEEAENAKMLGGKSPEQFAERFHAAQHYKGGADQITPKDIGALPETTIPADIGAEAARLQFVNISALAAAFIEDTTYENFPYRGAVALTGVTAAMVPEVVFGVGEATSGIFAPIAEAYDGGIYLYAAEIPKADITIPTIICWKAVG